MFFCQPCSFLFPLFQWDQAQIYFVGCGTNLYNYQSMNSSSISEWKTFLHHTSPSHRLPPHSELALHYSYHPHTNIPYEFAVAVFDIRVSLEPLSWMLSSYPQSPHEPGTLQAIERKNLQEIVQWPWSQWLQHKNTQSNIYFQLKFHSIHSQPSHMLESRLAWQLSRVGRQSSKRNYYSLRDVPNRSSSLSEWKWLPCCNYCTHRWLEQEVCRTFLLLLRELWRKGNREKASSQRLIGTIEWMKEISSRSW